MLTILLTDDTAHPEWKLFEPFFYHHEKDARLLRIPYDVEKGYHHTFQQIYNELIEKHEETWQLIILMHLDAPMSLSNRLVNQFNRLKTQLIHPLEKREAAPAMAAAILLDSLHNGNGDDPEDTVSQISVQMDINGYLTKGNIIQEDTNLWSEEDFHNLDQAWGEAINLQEVGLIEKPTKEFMADLLIRKQKVERVFERCLEEKQGIYENRNENALYLDAYSVFMKEDISDYFMERLEKELTPPLHNDLRTFKPSGMLKNVLKETLSIQGEEGFKLLRHHVSPFSKQRKYEQWLKVIAFINTTIDNPSIYGKIPDGSVYELKEKIDSESFQSMFQKYYEVLNAAIYSLENQLMSREEMVTTLFEETKPHPHTALEIKEDPFDFPVFQGKRKNTIVTDWKQLTKKIMEDLMDREKDMIEDAKSGIRTIKVLQRKKITKQHEELEIYEYLEQLRKKEIELLLQLERYTPPPLTEINKWKDFCNETEFELTNQIRAYPSKKNIYITSILIWLGLTGPMLAIMDWPPAIAEWHQWIFPALTTISVIGTSYIAVKRITQPIHDYLKDTEDKQKKLFKDQGDKHRDTNEYLNIFYALDRTQKKRMQVEELLLMEQEENHLLRFHLKSVREALDSLQHISHYLHIEKRDEENEERRAFVQAKFKPSEDIINNVIYSPIVCGETGLTERFTTEVHIGQSGTTIDSGKLRLLTHIKLEKDQVYLS
ncbi:hypothetical protein [Evansella tamaricis]|uniref:Uncharacterized protein n=1 Tax=Evansella tamaricis TaxID=2069301 RepID=A0ABS6JLW1_9BACI|nr:hypothetical protein [Evansella tamaricis]MBU9714375.1 hypothetical protein [Evansella tamaricis]